MIFELLAWQHDEDGHSGARQVPEINPPGGGLKRRPDRRGVEERGLIYRRALDRFDVLGVHRESGELAGAQAIRRDL